MPRTVAGAILWIAVAVFWAGGAAEARAGQVCVGNVVFIDTNGNGKYDAGEGVPNVEVDIFTSGTDPETGTPVQMAFTGSEGNYLFFFLDDGSYFVHIPASEFQIGGDLVGMHSIPGTSGVNADDDVGEDGIDDITPEIYGIRTPDIDVIANQAPTAATGETGFDSASDDFDDINTNLTVDFGFFRAVGLGNMVFVDTNGNGHADAGEGVSGVVVRLYPTGADPDIDPALAEVSTDPNGGFLFTDLTEGSYFVHIPATEFGVGRPLHGASTISQGSSSGDDDVGEDTVDFGNPAVEGAFSRTVALAAGMAPVNGSGETGLFASDDDYADADIDMTVDLGFTFAANAVGVGNVVFVDQNGNGHADPNEGINGVTVELFDEGADPSADAPVASQITSGGGFYFFGNLSAANYFVHIPASQFQVNAVLEGMASLPGADSAPHDDDVGEDGIDPAGLITAEGISSAVFALASGAQPTEATGETGLGANSDDFADDSVNLTIDFGFHVVAPPTMSVGNLVFIDGNGNGRYDSGEGAAGVSIQIFTAGANPAMDSPLAETVSNGSGVYGFGNLAAGGYFMHVPKSQFAVGGPLHGKESVPGNGADDGMDDDGDENGIDAADLDLHGISSIVFTLGNNQEPVDGGSETGFGAVADNADDNNSDLTIDLGFRAAAAPKMQLGNLVFLDANGNGHADVGEGVDGVAVQLFVQGQNPLADTPLSTTITANGGQYLFSDVAEGTYFIFLPPSDFLAAGPLHGKVSMPGAGGDTGADDSLDENGIDDPLPDVSGIRSGPVQLASNTEPVNAGTEVGLFAAADDADDDNGDVTIDFGFIPYCPVIAISPSILQHGTTGVAYSVTLTASGGQSPYSWEVIGTLPSGMTLSPAGLMSGTPDTVGTASFALRATDAGGCKVTSNYTLTIEIPMSVGNLVFVDANWNGSFDPGEGIDGVQVQLYHSADTPGAVPPMLSAVTTGGGLYLFSNVPVGAYFLHVPASMFAPGGPLAGKASLPGVSPGTDDDYGEDGLDAFDPATTGVSTASFTLANGTAPTGATFETGVDAASDDAGDANTDLTQDLGFRTPPLPGTFSTWQTRNPLGGSNAPGDDPDGDGTSNLIEYATNLAPDSGLSSVGAFRVSYNFAQSRFEAVFRRPLGGQQDLVFSLEGSTDPTLGGGWTPLGATPVVTNNADGTERVSFDAFSNSTGYQGASSGFVRLRVDLDADHDTVSEAVAFSEVWSWALRTFSAAPQTFSLPVLSAPLFAGTVTSVAGSSVDVSDSVGSGDLAAALQAGTEYYVEVTNGDNEGHRIEVDVANCTATTIVLNTAHVRSTLASLPASLAGDSITLRPHWRTKDALPVSRFHATNNSSTADRLQFYQQATNTYKILWLFLNAGNPKWVQLNDATLGDAGTRVIDAVEGVYVHSRTLVITLPVCGALRRNDVVCPLFTGSNLIGTFWGGSQSPSGRGMTVAGGFTGATSSANADHFRLWNPDTSTSQTFNGYYLLKTASIERWVRENDAQLNDQSNAAVFTPFRAAFIQVKTAKPAWKLPSPTDP